MIEDRIDFIQWLINRFIYKYRYDKDNSIIESLKDIQNILQKCSNIDITDNNLDKIISKYYIDFNLDKCDDLDIGFTDNERTFLRKNLRNMINDILQTFR